MPDWSTAFEQLVREHRATVRTSDGTCGVTFDCAPTSAERILAIVPGVWLFLCVLREK